MSPKPILYLDVDDTLLRFPPRESRTWWLAYPEGKAADGAGDFLRWAVEYCEVRWLTFWCCSGEMGPESAERLARLLDVPVALVAGIRNPLQWDAQSKTTGIDWDAHRAGRQWLWIEDEILDRERAELTQRGCLDRYTATNSSEDPTALSRAWDRARAMVASVARSPRLTREEL